MSVAFSNSNVFASDLMCGKTVLITGASGGLGGVIARKFTSLGAKVAIHYNSNKEKAVSLLNQIVAVGGKAEIFTANLEEAQSCIDLVKNVVDKFGKIDILVNNAVAYKAENFENIAPDDFYRQFSVNVLAPIILSQEAANYFPAQGGSIINIASVNSFIPSQQAVIYSASKAALVNLTTAMGRSLAAKKIRVNAVSPGPIEGEVKADIVAEDARRKYFTDQTPLAKRFADPMEIANMVIFLASDAASWITGKNYTVDGGYSDF